jgi:hypothetical protein
MDTPIIDALAKRIDRLERANRRWRWLTGLVLSAGLVVMICGAQRANEGKVIDAERIIVRDNDGNERVRLGVGSNGGAYLVLQAKDGNGGIELVSPSQGSPHLDVWDKAHGHIMLVATPDRMALDFLNENRVGQIALKIEKGDGTQYLSFLKEGRGNLSLGLNADGSGGMSVSALANQRHAELWLRLDGGPVLQVQDANGKTLAQIPAP